MSILFDERVCSFWKGEPPMLKNSALLSFLLIILVFSQFVCAKSVTFLHVEIIDIDLENLKIKVTTKDSILDLQVASDALILRGEQQVTLASARPIAEGIYQDALVYINQDGVVTILHINFKCEERKSKNGTELVFSDIFGKEKKIIPL